MNQEIRQDASEKSETLLSSFCQCQNYDYHLLSVERNMIMNPENIGIEYPILEEEEERKRKLLRTMIWRMKDGLNWMGKERVRRRERKERSSASFSA